MMSRQKLPTGSLKIVPGKTPKAPHYWECNFRHPSQKDPIHRRLGPAHYEPRETPLSEAEEAWQRKYKRKRGRPPEGYLSHEDALRAKRELIADFFKEAERRGKGDEATFRAIARDWLRVN